MNTTSRRTVRRLYVALAVVLVVFMVFPGYSIANRVEPFVLGLPFGLFWIILLQAIGFLGLCGLYLFERRQKENER